MFSCIVWELSYNRSCSVFKTILTWEIPKYFFVAKVAFNFMLKPVNESRGLWRHVCCRAAV